MKLEEELLKYQKNTQQRGQEAEIQSTVVRSSKAFIRSEENQTLAYHDFLWSQLKVIRKRWWLLQLLVLGLLALFILYEEDFHTLQRGMSVFASLFVILVIPELLKNRSTNSLEIEGAAFYSLRQIYAARLLLFGLADISLITLFCAGASLGLHIDLVNLMIHFLLPVCVTAGICLGIMSSKRHFSETAIIAACVLWSFLWLMIVLNEAIYPKLTLPLWLLLFGTALAGLVIAIIRVLRNANNYWEVSTDGIEM